MSMRNARALLARMMAEADNSSSDEERATAAADFSVTFAGRRQRQPPVVDLTISDEDDDEEDDAFDAFLVLQEHLGDDDDDDSNEALFGRGSTDGSAEDNLDLETSEASDSRGGEHDSDDDDEDDGMEEIGSPVRREFLAVRTRNGRRVILHDDDDSEEEEEGEEEEDNMVIVEPTFVYPALEASNETAPVHNTSVHAADAPPPSPVPAATAPTTPATSERTPRRGRKRRRSSRSKTEVVIKSQPTECPVCMEACTLSGPHRIVSLKCGHVFGQKCIERWLMERKKCPVCNHVVRKTDLRPLFSDHVAVIDSTDVENLTHKYEAEKSKRIQIQSELEHSKKQLQHMIEKRRDELFKWKRAYSELQRQLATERRRVQSVHADGAGHLFNGANAAAVNPAATAHSHSQLLTPQTAPQSTSNVVLSSDPIVIDGPYSQQ
uniref:RING-type domain-containing protein n=1 Tax=Globisporangium ultimum (strain ATCC 200006 / CBS 805.95 / DAOM BR144) TaxID=431595 RepID=K3WWP9_GLOUD